MLNKSFAYILNYFTIHKAAHKNNSRTHSSQQNKKAVLTIAAYCKVSAPVRSQRKEVTICYYKRLFKQGLKNLYAMLFRS